MTEPELYFNLYKGDYLATQKNDLKMEQEKIIQAILAIFNGADERDWQKVEQAMADNVLLDYASLSGNPAATLSAKQIIEAWRGFLPGFDSTHHHLSDFHVQQNGDQAVIHCKGKADHFLNNDSWTVEGTYDAEAAKVNGEWVVTKLKFNLSGQSGNTALPAQAAEKMKQ
jgi:SnoaL-like domain